LGEFFRVKGAVFVMMYVVINLDPAQARLEEMVIVAKVNI